MLSALVQWTGQARFLYRLPLAGEVHRAVLDIRGEPLLAGASVSTSDYTDRGADAGGEGPGPESPSSDRRDA